MDRARMKNNRILGDGILVSLLDFGDRLKAMDGSGTIMFDGTKNLWQNLKDRGWVKEITDVT